MAKKKAKRKVSTKAKRLVKRTEKAAKREGKKVGRGAKKLGKKAKKAAKREGKKVKRGAKKVGRKVKKTAKRVGKKAKKFAKTDTGRATIGAGAGALLLGPIGAIAGAAAGLATRKKNPSGFDVAYWQTKDRPWLHKRGHVTYWYPRGSDIMTGTEYPIAIAQDTEHKAFEFYTVGPRWDDVPQKPFPQAGGGFLSKNEAIEGAKQFIDAVESGVDPETGRKLPKNPGRRPPKKNPMSVSPKANIVREIFMLEQSVRSRDPQRATRLRKKHNAAFDYLERHSKAGKTLKRTHPMYMPIVELHSELSRGGNPERTMQVPSFLGNMMLDYQKASPAIEHVAAAAMRGEKVEISKVKAARDGLKSIRIKKGPGERKHLFVIRNAIDALDGRIATAEKRPSNPARAFSLEAQVKSGRQSRAKKAATSMAKHSKVYGEVKSKSLAKRLREINPEPVSHKEMLRSHRLRARGLSDSVLKRELGLWQKEPQVSKKGLVRDLARIYQSEEIKRSFRGANPQTVMRKKGKFHSVYVPTPEEVAEYERATGKKPPKTAGSATLDKLTDNYRKLRKRWLYVSTKTGSTPAETSRARKRMDDAENQLVLYAEISNMSPEDLKLYMRHAAKAQAKAKKARKRTANPSKEAHLDVANRKLAWAKKFFEGAKKTGGLQQLLRTFAAASTAAQEYSNAGMLASRDAQQAEAIIDASVSMISERCIASPRMRVAPNPRVKLLHIPSGAKKGKIREVVGRNIAKLSTSKDPRTKKVYKQPQAIAISLTQAREDAAKRPALKRTLTRMYGKAPKRNTSNPLAHIPKGAGLRKIRSIVSKNIAKEVFLGTPQRQAVAIGISTARADAKKIGGTTATLIHAEYPKPNPRIIPEHIKEEMRKARARERKGYAPTMAEQARESFAGETLRVQRERDIVVPAQKRVPKGRRRIVVPHKKPGENPRIIPEDIKEEMRKARERERKGYAPSMAEQAREEFARGSLRVQREFETVVPAQKRVPKGKRRIIAPVKRSGNPATVMTFSEAMQSGPLKPRKHKGYIIHVGEVGGEFGFEAIHPEYGIIQNFGYATPQSAFGGARRHIETGKNPEVISASAEIARDRKRDIQSVTKSKRRRSKKKLTKVPKGVKIQRLPPGKAEGAELPGEWVPTKYTRRVVAKGIGVRAASNPKKKKRKKATKKKAARKVTPEWQRLVRRCQKLWDHYCKRPGKARLKDALKHLEKMEGHASKKVREERSRCLRVAKSEAKKLKMRV